MKSMSRSYSAFHGPCSKWSAREVHVSVLLCAPVGNGSPPELCSVLTTNIRYSSKLEAGVFRPVNCTCVLCKEASSSNSH